MPEGHSVHRIARQFARNFVGRPVRASSPQGRFADGAAQLDGCTPTTVRAVGKQMFMEFDGDLWLRVHLGLYGAWDFAGEILVDPTIASANGRMGQTNQRGTDLAAPGDAPIFDDAGENSLASIGAPRRTRVHVRMSEQTKGLDEADGLEAPDSEWPPPVVGQVRLRLMTDVTCADLRGPTACAVETPEQVAAVIARLGPDPLVGDPRENEERFVQAVRAATSRSASSSWISRSSAASATCTAPRCCSARTSTRTRRAGRSPRRSCAACGATGSS